MMFPIARRFSSIARFVSIFAGLGATACSSAPPDSTGTAQQEETVGDPWDPASCAGAAMTREQGIALFAPGTKDTVIGSYVIQKRSRPCNALTGCGAWGPPMTRLGHSLGSLSADLEMTGGVHLKVLGTNIRLELVDATRSEGAGSPCWTVGDPQKCSAYQYVMGYQWGGSGGEFPTWSPVIKADGKSLALRGVLTNSCLRLTDEARSANTEEQYVLLATLTAPSTPRASVCPPDETSMSCGSRASAGLTVCCRRGLATCPQSGCDCWARCW